MRVNNPDNWEQDTMGALYEALLERMVVTYMINELLKSGVKNSMKTGVLEHLRARQIAANNRIAAIVREVDRQ